MEEEDLVSGGWEVLPGEAGRSYVFINDVQVHRHKTGQTVSQRSRYKWDVRTELVADSNWMVTHADGRGWSRAACT